GEAIEKACAGGKCGVGSPVVEVGPASAAVHIPCIGGQQLVHRSGVHHRVKLPVGILAEGVEEAAAEGVVELEDRAAVLVHVEKSAGAAGAAVVVAEDIFPL